MNGFRFFEMALRELVAQLLGFDDPIDVEDPTVNYVLTLDHPPRDDLGVKRIANRLILELVVTARVLVHVRLLERQLAHVVDEEFLLPVEQANHRGGVLTLAFDELD